MRTATAATTRWRSRPATSRARARSKTSGLPLHRDNETVVKERIYLDKADKDVLHDEITTIDHAFTRPWTVDKTYVRERKAKWSEYLCREATDRIYLGRDDLCGEPRRQADADPGGPAAARPAIFQAAAEITTSEGG